MVAPRTLTALVFLALATGLGQAAGPPPPVGRDWYGDPLPRCAVARLGTVRLRHPGGAWGLAFSGDGKLLVASDGIARRRGGVTRSWRVPDGKLLDVTEGVAVVSRSGDRLVALKQAGDGATLHDLTSGKVIARTRWLPPKRPPFLFSQRSMTAAALSYDSGAGVTLWDLKSGKTIGSVKGQFLSLSAVLSADGKTLLTGDLTGKDEGRIRFWDVATRKMTRDLSAGHGAAYALALSGDGKTLAVAHARATFFDDHDQTETAVTLRDAASGRELRVLSRHGVRTISLAFSPDGRTVAVGRAGSIHWAGIIELYDVKTGKKLDTPAGHLDKVVSAAFRRGSEVVTCGGCEVRVWDEAGKPLALTDLTSRLPNDLTVDPAGAQVAWLNDGDESSAGEKLFVRDLKTGKERGPFAAGEPWSSVWGFRHDGKVLALSTYSVQKGRHTAALLDVTKGTVVTVGGHRDDGAYGVAFSPDGARVAACDYDKPFTLHDAATGKKFRSFDAPGGPTSLLVISRDGRTLVASHGNQTVSRWDVATGKRWGEVIKHPANYTEGNLHAHVPVALSPDGTLLATGGVGRETTVRLWDVATGKELARLPGHALGVKTLVFSPDGKRLLSGSGDSTALVWDVAAALAGSSPPVPSGTGK